MHSANLSKNLAVPAPEEVLDRNLVAIGMVAPCLETLLKSRGSNEDHGESPVIPLQTEANIIDPPLPESLPVEGTPIFLLGMGTGEIADFVLGPGKYPVLIIEPEVKVLKTVLSRYDWAELIRQGRLTILAPETAEPVLSQIGLQSSVAEVQQRMIKSGGRAFWLVSGSYERNQPFFSQMEKAVSFFARFSHRLADQLEGGIGNYQSDIGIISPQCRIFDDLADCFRQLGLKTRLFRVPDKPGEWDEDTWFRLYQRICEAPCRLLLARNRTMLETENALERYNWNLFLPGRATTWWWDIPNVASQIDMACDSEPGTHFAFAKSIFPKLPGETFWLPAGALSSFTGYPIPVTSLPKPDLPLTFVGQSRVQNISLNIKILKQALSHRFGKNTIFQQEEIDGIRTIPEFAAFFNKTHSRIAANLAELGDRYPYEAYFLDYILNMIITGLFRLVAIIELRNAGIPMQVYGDDGWLKSGAVSPNQFKGLISPDRLPELYQRSTINLNLNFMQVASTVNPKVLDASAVGGTVLTDFRPELVELFPDPGIRPYSFHGIEDLPDKADYLLTADLSEHRKNLLIHTRRHHSLLSRAETIARQFGLFHG